MIDIIKQTPYEYSSQSRDYQVLARLYTALFNLTKMYIDNLQIWNTNIDNKLINLRSTTLNFEPKHYWDLDDLEAVTSSFKYLMRRKGTIKALEYCVNILMKVENISGEEIEKKVIFENNNVTIYTPENLLTLGIVEDLVKYLIPSGITYNIIKYKTSDAGGLRSVLYYKDKNLLYEESKYTDYMNLGPHTATINDDEKSEWMKITSKDKIWFGTLIEGEYVPDESLDVNQGVDLYDSEGNIIKVAKDEVNNVYVDVINGDDTKEEIGHFINRTFVTNRQYVNVDSEGNPIKNETTKLLNDEFERWV